MLDPQQLSVKGLLKTRGYCKSSHCRLCTQTIGDDQGHTPGDGLYVNIQSDTADEKILHVKDTQ